MAKKMLANKKGFSLIELIVVIAILGVIAVIAVPAVMSTLTKSKVDADIQSAQGIARGVKQGIISLNTDTPTANNITTQLASPGVTLADIDGAADTTALAGLKNFIEAKKKPSSNTGDFTITATVDDAGTPTALTVTFTENGTTHTVDGISGVVS